MEAIKQFREGDSHDLSALTDDQREELLVLRELSLESIAAKGLIRHYIMLESIAFVTNRPNYKSISASGINGPVLDRIARAGFDDTHIRKLIELNHIQVDDWRVE